MTHIEQAIRDAVEKGGYGRPMRQGLFGTNNFHPIPHSEVLLDPALWQALGKARWSKVAYGRSPGAPREYWQAKWHDFIDHLAEGKDAESFFATLE